MSIPVSARGSLINRFHLHLRTEAYSRSVQRCYPNLARQFLNYCDSKALAIEAVRPAHVTQFLRWRYRIFCRRHENSPPFHQWRWRHTGAVHVLLRLVHGRWPVADSPTTVLEALHRDIVQEYDVWMRDLRGLRPETRIKRTTHALRFLVSLGSLADQEGLAVLSVRDVDAYLRQCCRGLRRASIEDCTVCLRDFLRHLYRSRRTAADLSGTVIGPRIYDHEDIPSALRAEEVRRVLEVTREDLSPVGLNRPGFRGGCWD